MINNFLKLTNGLDEIRRIKKCSNTTRKGGDLIFFDRTFSEVQ